MPTIIQITLAPPVVCAQAEEEGLPWGVWQFPMIMRTGDGELGVFFSRSIDDSAASAAQLHPVGCSRSRDGGHSWAIVPYPPGFRRHDKVGRPAVCECRNGDRLCLMAPASEDIPKEQLPPPTGFCDHGYNNVYSVRDPLRISAAVMGRWHLARRRAGAEEWESLPVKIDDPDEGVLGFDPPGQDFATIHWGTSTSMHQLELPKGRLLEIRYGYRLNPDRTPHPKWESWCLASEDGGLTWSFHGTIARDDEHPIAGFTEPSACVLPDGTLLAALRTEAAIPGALYLAHSADGGRTWSPTREVYPFGVLPQLLTLDCGVTVLAFGRPGVHLRFSVDNGQTWENHRTLVQEEDCALDGLEGVGVGFQPGEQRADRPRYTCTCGYTGLLATGPDRFLITYSAFNYPDRAGQPRKTILVREVVVECGAGAKSTSVRK